MSSKNAESSVGAKWPFFKAPTFKFSFDICIVATSLTLLTGARALWLDGITFCIRVKTLSAFLDLTVYF
jgi:hypothetical protein